MLNYLDNVMPLSCQGFPHIEQQTTLLILGSSKDLDLGIGVSSMSELTSSLPHTKASCLLFAGKRKTKIGDINDFN
jgi:hypothetical protein